MTVSLGADHNETFYAYVPPDVSTFYNATAKSYLPLQTKATGFFGKFVNLSPHPVKLYFAPVGKNRDLVYMADIEAFGATGTATYPSHKFLVTDPTSPSTVLHRWTLSTDTSLYYYDPLDFDVNKAYETLSSSQFPFYQLQWQNKVFAEQYKAFTGTEWLALYKQKEAPRFHMWRADSFGQTHSVTTKEIHFTEFPEQGELARGTSIYGPRPDEVERVRRHRHQYPTLDLTLTALSCSPRVFEIRNFLSPVEVEHLRNLIDNVELERSKTQASENSEDTTNDETRTSSQTWIPRATDIITDAIYKRAADVLQMDESLLRWRRPTEIPEFSESKIAVSESLQAVHYAVGQQYTPHYDFTMPGMVNLQPSRFATILFYLNDNMEGGETSFPRWLNGETPEALKVKPELGKAILFYDLLPDGNYDERSQHAALPVTEGEKWLTNL
jgi:prolyl 4-hydroxylase